MRRLLLLSNSTQHGHGYLDHAIDEIRGHLAGVSRLLFVPFALHDRAGYSAKARERFAPLGIEVDELLAAPSGARQVETAAAVFVGGGNTFRLLKTLREAGLAAPLRERVLGGMPYLGASAGINIAAPTIRTTNDMPIVEPPGFEALGLVPFQINPHYLDPPPDSTHMGETREQRILEFLEENDRPVVGLREGGWLAIAGAAGRIGGLSGARIFRPGAPPEERSPGAPLDDLLAG
ncbi:MAG: dipeptidase PepE [Thermoanaerobaculia bacterium]|nr:MAG: dipeptidase PepE [Thermoanaerobaculia bacterium]MBZ0103724.1 dipeptidase PepE [Thermoanaerobaculia bacterium]